MSIDYDFNKLQKKVYCSCYYVHQNSTMSKTQQSDHIGSTSHKNSCFPRNHKPTLTRNQDGILTETASRKRRGNSPPNQGVGALFQQLVPS